ncbi:hypothetical protein [Actinoplanes sp. L3-i22]|uniref:hypothetical protein n=1 Tax=Actinoplanes sp. L3-i22 TaxID=2836373 RepID=UPI001C75B9C2|nr:hypothetical protein [Actinoplanes sp. L3-i22]BCY08627.1 hypothetical protein L3i22_037150 [Actinoplanes sp. L3-i22]
MTDSLVAPRGSDSRRFTRAWIAGLAAVALSGLAFLVIGGRIPGIPCLPGPLEGASGVSVTVPLRPSDTGALWGALILHNAAVDGLVLESVSLADNPDGLAPSRSPYIWDDSRVAMLGFASVAAYNLPLPASWRIPVEQSLAGYRMRKSEDATVEVLVEFAPPEKASTVSGIAVRYRVGWRTYRKVFDLAVTLCPPADTKPCS